jgi:hypothetical protein
MPRPLSRRGRAEDVARMKPARSSRGRYLSFVQAYKDRRLDDPAARTDSPEAARPAPAKRREYLRDYVRWLRPHRYAVAAFFVLALLAA